MARRDSDSRPGRDEAKSDSLLDRMQDFDRWRTGGAGPVASPAPPAAPPGSAPAPPPGPAAADDQRPVVVQQVVPYLGWEPGPIRVPQSGRAFRWTVLLVVLAIAAGIAFLLRWVPTIAENEAETVTAEFQAALGGLAEAIPSMDAALPALTDPDQDLEAVSGLVAISRFQGAVADLGRVAREPLPSTPPLVPRDPLDELEPLKDDLALVAGRADLIANRIARIVTYRTMVERAFLLPDLTNSASLEETNDVAVALAAMLAETLEALTQMPDDPLLDDHRAQAQTLFDWLEQWEVRYLEALRTEDDSAASFAARDAQLRVIAWKTGIEQPLEEVRQWLSRELSGLRLDIQRASALVP